MQQPAEPLAIGPPAQIRVRIHRALGGFLKSPALQREDARKDAAKSDLIDRQRRLIGAAPHALIGVFPQSVDYFTKSGAPVRTIFSGERFDPKISHSRLSLLC